MIWLIAMCRAGSCKRVLALGCLGLSWWTGLLVGAEPARPVSSGLEDIEQMAQAVARSPTNAANFRERYAMLSSWCRLLMHQGVDLTAFEPVVAELRGADRPSPPAAGGGPRRRAADDPAIFAAIDEGYRVLGNLQANPTRHPVKNGLVAPSERGQPSAWGLFHGNSAQTGYTADPGPTRGQLAWKFPIGHAWYARPAVEAGRVYVASPGLITIAYCLDERTGQPLWKAKQYGINLYTTARVSSNAVLLPDALVLRESGSGGEQRSSVDLLHLDKATGRILRESRAGHVDYRRGHAPVSGSGRYLAYPRGYTTIQNRPPLSWMLDTVVLADAQSGRTLWEFRTGDIFGEVVVADAEVYAATTGGELYSLNAEGGQRVRWVFAAGAALPGTPEVTIDTVLIGDARGRLHALDRRTGARRWVFEVPEQPDGRAFQFFSTPRMAGDRVYIGAADRHLYCLEAATGRLAWRAHVGDWVRSRPLVIGASVYVGSMDGKVHAFAMGGSQAEKRWVTTVTSHQLLADLEGSSTGLLASSNDLLLTSVHPESGKIQWRHSLLEAAYVDGERVPADVIAGGADFQSSPSAVEGIVYIGSPNRFVYAIDAATGRERWRFETSGQVSAQPIVADGRVYFGQQGGDKSFYCVDARSGAPLWRQSLGQAWASAGYQDGQLFVGTVEGEVHCVRASDGKLLWTRATQGGIYPAPATDERTVYTGSWDGHYYAFHRDSGKVRWAYHLGGSPDSAAPILWQGALIIQALSRHLEALDTATGSSRWKFAVPAGFHLNATPAAREDRVFFSIVREVNVTPSGARIVAIDARNGEKQWEFAPGGGLTGPSIARDRVFFGSTTDVYFTCVDARGNGDGTTSLHWRYRMGGVVEESCPAIHGSRAFVLCSDRHLYAFD